ncbi:MAG: hypothetical protein MUF84_18450 [Anaerolineae bacterium]|nr:hypothetical protein [Anaerolineae bacterium]
MISVAKRTLNPRAWTSLLAAVLLPLLAAASIAREPETRVWGFDFENAALVGLEGSQAAESRRAYGLWYGGIASDSTVAPSSAVGRSARAPVSGDEWFEYFRATYGDDAVEWTSLRTGSYREMRDALRGTGLQANHLNQDAAFRGIIPRNEGVSVGLRGNAFTEAGTEHFLYHGSLERFWPPYRSGGALFGARPTIAQYEAAVASAMREAGYSPGSAAEIARRAAAQVAGRGLGQSSPVPRIPGILPQRR